MDFGGMEDATKQLPPEIMEQLQNVAQTVARGVGVGMVPKAAPQLKWKYKCFAQITDKEAVANFLNDVRAVEASVFKDVVTGVGDCVHVYYAVNEKG